ncbi:hypothetical protein WV31_10065 [Magnetospirillum sp. ME-1]|uniref:hypothetical protein n=1 Tax=Magnetospirillum sp. ME-1 TaxID=1639348 RepID=UPI000A17989C|nr:hypothetical protein [Magnetospirillum sp. ME-1]ARJ65972.1 hypothetical protein WV31_10065 [Magnetospirillum sp. ME-1]
MTTAYDLRYAQHRDALRALAERVAAPLGARVVEDEGDEAGWSVLLARGDGTTMGIQIRLIDSEDPPGVAGNLIVRVESDAGAPAFSWGPDNYTPACWAAYGDSAAWERKLGILAGELDRLAGMLA